MKDYDLIDKFGNIRFMCFMPENRAKHESLDYCHEESDTVILRISPVRPILFPEVSFALNKKRLGILGWEVQILGIWCWSTKLLNKLLVPPEEKYRENR